MVIASIKAPRGFLLIPQLHFNLVDELNIAS